MNDIAIMAQADEFMAEHPDIYITRPSRGCAFWAARDRSNGTILVAETSLHALMTSLIWLFEP